MLVPTSQEQDRRVEGLLLVSTDKAVIAKVRKAFEFGMPFPKLVSAVANQSLSVEPWGKRSAIAIDRNMGTLAKRRAKAEVVALLAERIGDDLTLRLDDVSPSQQALISDQLLGQAATGLSPHQVTIGADLSLSIRPIDPSGAKSTEVTVPSRNKATARRRERLMASPIPGYSTMSATQKSEVHAKLIEREEGASQLTMTTFGIADRNLTEGLHESERLLREMIAASDRDLASASKAFVERLDPDHALAGLAPTYDSLDTMPESMRARVEDGFASGFAGYGFGSRQEALDYIRGIGRFEVSTNVSLMFCVRPSGPRQSAAFGVIQIASYPGTP